MTAKHVVGIDLGTTHSALAFANAEVPDSRPEVLEVPQLVSRGLVERRMLLPSFLYFGHSSDGALSVPWDEHRTFAVGEYARARAAETPGRVVSSAKSWLCHPSLDRRGPILPQGAAEDVEKISPVEASFRYLDHLGEAWSARGGDSPLAEQSIVLAVPASFDAGARELTVEAAYAAGMEDVTLLEEPQAALYAWIEAAGDWRKQLAIGDVVLIVDVGGGTTDFSAVSVVDSGGDVELRRVAVGDHILLGGDNMDLALAHVVKTGLESDGKELDRWQLQALTHGCRAAKERLLSSELESLPIVVPSRGSQLLGGSLRATLERAQTLQTVVDGFFPEVNASEEPQRRARAGLTQVGLPYAADAAVTRHLATFLRRQAGAVSEGGAARPLLCPTAVLFNGGVLKATSIRDRLMATLNRWLAEAGAPPARLLPAADLDLAVARGACYYGLVRRGRGLRIRGGTARAYYVGIESPAPAVPGVAPPVTALCVAPFGMEEGTAATLPPHELGVVVGEPVRFRFFGSSVRRGDAAGTELERWKPGELEELPPIEITLPSEGRVPGDVVPVRLESSVTPVGTLAIEAVPFSPKAQDERWKVELSVR